MSAQVLTLEELAPRLSRFDRLMGLDIGTKTIGLALSDVERRLASPFDTIRRRRFSEDSINLMKRAAEFQIAALVVGLPLNMDGSEGPRAQSTRAFVRNLPPQLLVSFWDERLSTALVTRELIAQDVSRRKRAQIIDRMAAAYILQGALDRLANIGAAQK
jgi:putative holliday junction resolvase